MKIISELIDKMEDTLEEAEFYGEKAMQYHTDYKHLANTYAKAGEVHTNLYLTLHETVVALINAEKSKGVEVPKEMQFYYDQMHKKMVARYNKAKFVLEEYKKMGY